MFRNYFLIIGLALSLISGSVIFVQAQDENKDNCYYNQKQEYVCEENEPQKEEKPTENPQEVEEQTEEEPEPQEDEDMGNDSEDFQLYQLDFDMNDILPIPAGLVGTGFNPSDFFDDWIITAMLDPCYNVDLGEFGTERRCRPGTVEDPYAGCFEFEGGASCPGIAGDTTARPLTRHDSGAGGGDAVLADIASGDIDTTGQCEHAINSVENDPTVEGNWIIEEFMVEVDTNGDGMADYLIKATRCYVERTSVGGVSRAPGEDSVEYWTYSAGRDLDGDGELDCIIRPREGSEEGTFRGTSMRRPLVNEDFGSASLPRC